MGWLYIWQSRHSSNINGKPPISTKTSKHLYLLLHAPTTSSDQDFFHTSTIQSSPTAAMRVGTFPQPIEAPCDMNAEHSRAHAIATPHWPVATAQFGWTPAPEPCRHLLLGQFQCQAIQAISHASCQCAPSQLHPAIICPHPLLPLLPLRTHPLSRPRP